MKQPFITYLDVPIEVDTETGAFSVTIHEREQSRYALDDIKKMIERSFAEPKPVRKDVNLSLRCFDNHDSGKVVEVVYVGVHKKGNAAPEHVFRDAKGEELRSSPSLFVPTHTTKEQIASLEAAYKAMNDARRAFEDAKRAAGIKESSLWMTLSVYTDIGERIKAQQDMASMLAKYAVPES